MGAAAQAAKTYRTIARIKLPDPHEAQSIFVEWEEDNPSAQVLVAPCGTKVGKTFGSSLWLLTQALVNPGFYCVWIAPTLYKCRIAYRYMKAMLPQIEYIDCKDGALEIWFGNGSFIKFLHGRDAEVTVEGEAIDAFVIDEAGKQSAQTWYSLFTTITQTEGRGIVTGTPRGRTWYYDVYQQALNGDPFYAHTTLRTIDSPFIKQTSVDKARRILPAMLFAQYYLAQFVSDSSVYGDLSQIWDDTLKVERKGFWIHPDEKERAKSVVVGFDIAKRNDYSVLFALNADGKTVGYARFRHKPYRQQAHILGRFLGYFTGEDNMLRYDRTGVGDAVGEEVSAVVDAIKGDWTVQPVVFTNAGKQDMVSRVTFAIETGWWKCPRIARVEHEFVNLEVTVTRSGLAAYAAPEGDHDDVHWAAALAISGAHASNAQGDQIDLIEAALNGKLLTKDEDEEEDEDADGAGDDDDLGDLVGEDTDDVLEGVGEMM